MKIKFLCVNKQTFCTVRTLFARRSIKNDEVTNLINDVGYKGEAHKVKTDDGYFLTVHRIRAKENEKTKGTAFLMHGLFRNSADFLATGPKIALPYLLADRGWDVFIGNARGSKFSTEHEKHSYKSSEFWNFSWHEIGYFDLPAMLEFALVKSKSSEIFYTGHSQGCSSILALLSSRPSFNSMISQMHLLAPPIFMSNATSPAFKIGSRLITSRLAKSFDKFDISPFLKFANFLSFQSQNPESLKKLYKAITCRLVGQNNGDVQLSMEAIKSFNHFMSPIVSMKQLNHYMQLYRSGLFHQYDYEGQNHYHYGTVTPPKYNLENVIAPAYLYHAEQDMLVDRKGVDQLSKALPNVHKYEIIHDFNHLDVMLGKNARKMVYEKILEYMENKK